MNQATGLSDGELRQRVRDDLGRGKLFRVDGNGFAGRGTQQRCAVCNRPIPTPDIEIRIEEPRQVFALAAARLASHYRYHLDQRPALLRRGFLWLGPEWPAREITSA